MRKKVLAAAFLMLLPTAALPTKLSISPASVRVRSGETFEVLVCAKDLADAKGIDLVLTWNPAVLGRPTMSFNGSALPGFTESHRVIDAEAGMLEIVLARQSSGGYTGDATGFARLTFEGLAKGDSYVWIASIFGDGDPIIVDTANRAVRPDIEVGIVTVESVEIPDIRALTLHQNYPNPFNPSTTIRFDVPKAGAVNLRIYGADGRLVRRLIEGKIYGVGSWEMAWDGRNGGGILVPSGIYLGVLESGGERSSVKLVVLR